MRLLEQSPPSHPQTCLQWINSVSPSNSSSWEENPGPAGPCAVTDTHTSLQEPSWRLQESQLLPAGEASWAAFFLSVSFLLSCHFYWNSENPHVYFCTASERFVPRWLTQKAPFARLKLNFKNKEKIKTVQPLPRPRHALSLWYLPSAAPERWRWMCWADGICQSRPDSNSVPMQFFSTAITAFMTMDN